MLPPGSGKTLVGLWVAESFWANNSKAALVVVPTLPLIDQTLLTYQASVGVQGCRLLVVASQCADSDVQRTTDPDKIEEFLHRTAGKPALLMATYKSLPSVGKSLSAAPGSIGLVIFDEAHLLAGGSKDSGFGLCHTKLPIPRRLFLTGTPRLYPPHTAAAMASPLKQTVRSMSDTALFGPTVYRMSHREGVVAGIVADLKLLVLSVSESYERLCKRSPELAIVVEQSKVPRQQASTLCTSSCHAQPKHPQPATQLPNHPTTLPANQPNHPMGCGV